MDVLKNRSSAKQSSGENCFCSWPIIRAVSTIEPNSRHTSLADELRTLLAWGGQGENWRVELFVYDAKTLALRTRVVHAE